MSARINRRAVLGAAAAMPVAALPSTSLATDRGAWDAAVAQFRVVQKRADAAGEAYSSLKQAFGAAKRPYPDALPAADYPNFVEATSILTPDKKRGDISRYAFEGWTGYSAGRGRQRIRERLGTLDDLEARRGMAVFRRIDRDNARMRRSMGVDAAFDASKEADYAEADHIDEVLLPCPVPDLRTLIEKAELLKDHTEGEQLVDAMLVDLRRLAGAAS